MGVPKGNTFSKIHRYCPKCRRNTLGTKRELDCLVCGTELTELPPHRQRWREQAKQNHAECRMTIPEVQRPSHEDMKNVLDENGFWFQQ